MSMKTSTFCIIFSRSGLIEGALRLQQHANWFPTRNRASSVSRQWTEMFEKNGLCDMLVTGRTTVIGLFKWMNSGNLFTKFTHSRLPSIGGADCDMSRLACSGWVYAHTQQAVGRLERNYTHTSTLKDVAYSLALFQRRNVSIHRSWCLLYK